MMRAVTLGLVSFLLFGFVPLEAEDSVAGSNEASTFPKFTFTAKDRQRFDSGLIGMKGASRTGTASTAKVPRFDPERVAELWKAYLKRVEEVEPLNLEFVEKAADILELKKEEIISGPGFAEWRKQVNPHGRLRPGVINSWVLDLFLEDAEKVLQQKGERLRTNEKSKIEKAWKKRSIEIVDIMKDFSGDISKHIRFSRTKARKYLLEKYKFVRIF